MSWFLKTYRENQPPDIPGFPGLQSVGPVVSVHFTLSRELLRSHLRVVLSGHFAKEFIV